MIRLPKRNRAQLEKLAEEFLAKHGKYDGRALMLELVIQRFGWEIVPISGLGTIAEAFVPMSGRRIFVDENQYRGVGGFRWRFTLAEELAHIILHRPLFDQLPTLAAKQRAQDQLSDTQYQQIEREAKYVASCLLLRRIEFVSRYQRHWSLQSTAVANDLAVLKHTIRQLSFDFDVSQQTVALRALQLNLIDQEQYTEWLDLLDR